jgi:glycosyltransferase 2 family protein
MEIYESEIAGKPSEPSGTWKTATGYIIAVLCLIWVFHDVQIGKLIESIARINWWWVAGAVALDTFSYACQGMRWRLLLNPLGNISTFRTTQAVYAGLFVNEILPMRLGEVLRIYLVAERLSVRFAAVVPSILVERFFDGIWLALAFGITMFAVPLPDYLVDSEVILGLIALTATVLLIYLVLYKKSGREADSSAVKKIRRPLRWVEIILNKTSKGIREIGRSPSFYSSFGISLLLLVGQMVSYWLVMMAYGLNLSFWHGAAVFLIVHIGTAIPSAPSNVGTYQFFTVVGLTLFAVDKTLATSFSIVVFLILTLPLWGIGMLAFANLGLNLKKVRADIASLTGD